MRFVAAAVLAGASAALLHVHGRSVRRVLPEHQVSVVRSGSEALDAWRAAGVHGRLMVWLAPRLPIEPVSERSVAAFVRRADALTEDLDKSFLYLALKDNIVRRVVYLVPDDRWPAVAARLSRSPDFHGYGSGFIQFFEGVPIVSLRASDRGEAVDERPLLHVGASARGAFGNALSDELIASADLVTVWQ